MYYLCIHCKHGISFSLNSLEQLDRMRLYNLFKKNTPIMAMIGVFFCYIL